MGMRYMVLFKEHLSPSQETKVTKTLNLLFNEIDSTLNRWNINSEISKWNNSKKTDPIKISPLFLKALLVSDQVHQESDGFFDPTLGRAIHLWKMSLRMGKMLTHSKIETLKISSGWDKIRIINQTLQKLQPDIELDFDGITKGLFCDLLTSELKKLGFDDFLVEWAGEIKISGGPFRVLSGKKVLMLKDTSIATSGPNYQFYKVDDKIYSHFISPNTLLPIEIENPQRSLYSINGSCAIADGMATCLFLQ